MPQNQPTDQLRAAAAVVFQSTTRLARRIRSSRSTTALSTNKVAVLSHLRRHGPSTPAAIAAADRQQPQSLTRVFADLEQGGLITRTPDPEDRRQTIVAITRAGQDALDLDIAEREEWLASALAELTDTERRLLVLAAGLMDRIADSAP